MIGNKRCAWVILVILGITCSSLAWAQDAATEQAGVAKAGIMDKRALDTLKTMSDTIRQAKSMSFRAYSMVPKQLSNGMWISLFEDSKVKVLGKNKLFVETRGDVFSFDLYYDGKTITTYAPKENIYALKDLPGTVDTVIENAYKEEGKSFPYADILVAEPYSVMTRNIVDAIYVGQSIIGSAKTDHLAFSNKGVDWQIWIGADDHLPRLVNATYLDDIAEPSYTVEFSDWKLDQDVPANSFIYENTSKAAKVEFRVPRNDKIN
jgi:hypothetical protein